MIQEYIADVTAQEVIHSSIIQMLAKGLLCVRTADPEKPFLRINLTAEQADIFVAEAKRLVDGGLYGSI